MWEIRCKRTRGSDQLEDGKITKTHNLRVALSDRLRGDVALRKYEAVKKELVTTTWSKALTDGKSPSRTGYTAT